MQGESRRSSLSCPQRSLGGQTRSPQFKALALPILLLSSGAALAQVPDSVQRIRQRIGCPSLEGTWSITLVLDSSYGPRYPRGRSATGVVTLGGKRSRVPFDRDYPCRASGRFDIDQRSLWGSAIHPAADPKQYRRSDLDAAYADWMGGPGREDSVMIDLATIEPGGLSLRGQTRADSIAGNWYLLTCDVCTGASASGHFVMNRRALDRPPKVAPPALHALLGCWRLSAPEVKGMYAQISGKIDLTDHASQRSFRFPPGLGLRLLPEDRDRRALDAEWVAMGANEGTISWGSGTEGYNLHVAVFGDSLIGTARGWTDGGFISDSVRVVGQRGTCNAP